MINKIGFKASDNAYQEVSMCKIGKKFGALTLNHNASYKQFVVTCSKRDAFVLRLLQSWERDTTTLIESEATRK